MGLTTESVERRLVLPADAGWIDLSHWGGQGGSCAFFGHTLPQAKHSAQEIDPGHKDHEARWDKERTQTGAPH